MILIKRHFRRKGFIRTLIAIFALESLLADTFRSAENVVDASATVQTFVVERALFGLGQLLAVFFHVDFIDWDVRLEQC